MLLDECYMRCWWFLWLNVTDPLPRPTALIPWVLALTPFYTCGSPCRQQPPPTPTTHSLPLSLHLPKLPRLPKLGRLYSMCLVFSLRLYGSTSAKMCLTKNPADRNSAH